MYTALALLLLILCLVVHEAGHAIAMRRFGVEIQSAGIGFGPSLHFHPNWISFPLALGLLPVGAYVKPTEKGNQTLKELPYREQAIIFGAGPLMNFAFTGVLLIGIILTATLAGNYHHAQGRIIILSVICGLLVGCWKRIGLVCKFVLPVLGVVQLAFVIILIASDLSNVSGPVGIVHASGSSSLSVAVLFGAGISLAIGLFNLSPIAPLDGGQMMAAALMQRFGARTASIYTGSTTLVLVIFVVGIVSNDILNL